MIAVSAVAASPCTPEAVLAHVHAAGWRLSLGNLLDYLKGHFSPSWTWPPTDDPAAWQLVLEVLPGPKTASTSPSPAPTPSTSSPTSAPAPAPALGPTPTPRITSPAALVTHVNGLAGRQFATPRDLHAALREILGPTWSWPPARDLPAWSRTVEAAVRAVQASPCTSLPNHTRTVPNE